MTYTKFFHSDTKEKNSNPVTKRTHDTVSCLNTAVNATITAFFLLCLQQEKEMDSERIEDLLAQNAQLELDARH